MEAILWPLAAVPQVVEAGRFALRERAHEVRHRAPTHALHVHGYPGRMRLAGHEFALSDGDVTVTPAGIASSYAVPHDGWHWCVHFRPIEAGEDSIDLPLHVATGELAAAMRERVARIAAMHGRGADTRTSAVSAGLTLQQLLLWLVERKNAPVLPGPAERAAAMIDTHFAEPLDVPAIAAAAGCSPAYLARVFQARFGTTVLHRLIARRADHARYLLESTDLPIWRIAERVGIPDAQHFNKTIRRMMGANPSAIRGTTVGPTIDPDR